MQNPIDHWAIWHSTCQFDVVICEIYMRVSFGIVVDMRHKERLTCIWWRIYASQIHLYFLCARWDGNETISCRHEQTLVIFESQYDNFRLRTCIWKCCLQHSINFVQAFACDMKGIYVSRYAQRVNSFQFEPNYTSCHYYHNGRWKVSVWVSIKFEINFDFYE